MIIRVQILKQDCFIGYFNFLKPLDIENLISIWADTELEGSKSWRCEIKNAIDNSTVAILLVSPVFLESGLIRTNELPQILRNTNLSSNAEVNGSDMSECLLTLPILIRSCLINHYRFIMLNISMAIDSKLSVFHFVPKGNAVNGSVNLNKINNLRQLL